MGTVLVDGIVLQTANNATGYKCCTFVNKARGEAGGVQARITPEGGDQVSLGNFRTVIEAAKAVSAYNQGLTAPKSAEEKRPQEKRGLKRAR